MIPRVKHYLHKFIKVHLAPEWNFFGQVVLVDEENDLMLLTTESAEISVKISEILVITHVPANEKGLPVARESQYHPTKRFAYRK